MMTKKDFEALAGAMLHQRPHTASYATLTQWRKDVEAIADVCQASNPNFDRPRFMVASGYMNNAGDLYPFA